MAYKATVPGAENMTIFNPEDEADGLKITLIESMYGLPESAVKRVQTIARIPHHDYANLHPVWNNPDDKPDSCFLFHVEGRVTEEEEKELQKNELFIETWFDDEPVNQGSIFMKMIDALNVDDDDDDSSDDD
jgi:hypothetical protein